MYFCYPENQPRGGFSLGPYDDLPAAEFYLTHLRNKFYLSFILKNETDTLSKIQASKEMETCERKLAYWKRHPNFNNSKILEETERLKKDWSGKTV